MRMWVSQPQRQLPAVIQGIHLEVLIAMVAHKNSFLYICTPFMAYALLLVYGTNMVCSIAFHYSSAVVRCMHSS